MTSAVFVGNDVVDLENPRTEGRATDDRFVGRVFDADEQAGILESEDPDLELWARWAAKEAGFKVVSKLIGKPPPFIHRRFKVAWSTRRTAADESPETVIREGSVRYHDHAAQITVSLLPGRVHAVAIGTRGQRTPTHVVPRVARLDSPGSAWAGSLEELRARLTERELDAVYSRESAAVRVGARGELAELLGVDEDRLEIVCAPGPASQRPPQVLLDGRAASADVSLSHDGRWIAWALSVVSPREGEA